MIEEVLAGVYCSDHPVAEGKNGIVFGTRYVLVVDTGNAPADGERMAAFIRSRGRRPDWVALTHGHGDHVRGAPAFAGAPVVAHALVERSLARLAESPASGQRTPSPAAAAGLIPPPAVTFSHELRLDLGGRHVRLFHTPGHSADSVCLLLEEDEVLFGGDTAVTGIVPAFGDGSGRQLEATLRRLAEVPARVLVPGHGPLVRGRERVREWLTWMAEYLAAVREYVERARRAGRPEAVIVQALDFESFVGGRLPAARHGMVRRHQDTARTLLRELQASPDPIGP